ncbi:DUF2726 domain-containing protein [Cytobacillus praedii]|uniref:DUF2726 domain-containing protein n=2 Tax=Cytobacillus praedii TaxID=1742358 RepID=A0A4R1ASL1_9BACI|nr:DUF2726 domain-containing protein [Cytobacillus praedii]
MSIGEKSIEKWLINNNIKFTPQYKFPDCKYINALPFDFAVFDNENKLLCLIEYDGEQHFESIEYFGGEEKLEITKIRDEIKNRYCEDNNLVLIRIPFWEKDNINNILDNTIKSKTTDGNNTPS